MTTRRSFLIGHDPIVFATVSDPVEEGLTESFPPPGGNVTGDSTLNWN